jgi:hypothetical protein
MARKVQLSNSTPHQKGLTMTETIQIAHQEIWERCCQNTDHNARLKARQDLVDIYARIVKYVAGRMAVGLPHYVEFNDLISAGLLGLIQAIDNFDPFYDPAVKRRNLAGLAECDRFSLVEGDICDTAAVDRALSLNPSSAAAWQAAAATALEEARWVRSNGRDPRAVLQKGDSAAARALELRADSAEVQLILGLLLVERGSSTSNAVLREDTLAEARKHFERARTLDPILAELEVPRL